MYYFQNSKRSQHIKKKSFKVFRLHVLQSTTYWLTYQLLKYLSTIQVLINYLTWLLILEAKDIN